jgi:homoserine O-acetyltransferase
MSSFVSETRFAEIATPDRPFKFTDGGVLKHASLAYETYGRLNEQRTNAILLFHALSGSQHAAGKLTKPPHPAIGCWWNEENHGGWWDAFIGPGKAVNTRKYFLICVNYIGGCYGSTGPWSINPETGERYGGSFPNPTMSDIVDTQVRLLDQLGIKKLMAVVGASLGGFGALDFAVRYPERVHCVIPVATGLRATVLTKAMNLEQIYAIEEDQNFRAGNYYDGAPPNTGLTLARMISHKTFVSLSLMESRAKKEIRQPDDVLPGYKLQHQVESYILHQGRKFVKRFDANSYLRIVKMWQSFNLPEKVAGGDVTRTFKRCKHQEWLLFSINSDVCFFPDEQLEIANALKANEMDYQHITVNSEKGHDSFLIEPDLYTPYISFKLGAVYDQLANASYEI